MIKELLAPAGDMACLKAAVNNGANAVYLAGKAFGARKYAKNFTNDELKEAVRYAHLYDVKIYVTVNTIIYEDEINSCIEYLSFLYSIDVDAVIVQDIGLIKLVRSVLPNLIIHASTQAHTHNLEQIKLLEDLGVKRVVLARELSIDEINSLDTNMEIEIFIHGALCISYSGQCLFSYGLLNRSGNRGECAGICRTPFNLLNNNKAIIKDKYLLSPKELNTTEYINELKRCKATSFKIEGRMKSAEYVGYVTHLYRKLLDNDNYKLSEEEVFNLKSLYNREFTKGYLFHEDDKNLISIDHSNHQGAKIGQVIQVTPDKIKVKLSHGLNQEDGIRLPNNKGMIVNFLYNKDMLLINHGNKDDIVYLDNKVDLKTTGSAMLTTNKSLSKELKSKLEKKIKIDCIIQAYAGENLIVEYKDNRNTVKYVGDIINVAKCAPLTKDRIKQIFSKLGNTPFIINNIEVNIGDNIFIPIGALNEIRRNLCDELLEKRMINTKKFEKFNDIEKKYQRNNKSIKISALARTEEQIKTLLDLNIDYLYVTNKDLYQKYKKDNVYLRLDRIISMHIKYQNENLLIGETGSLIYTSNNNVVTDYYLNIVNHYYIDFLNSLKVKRITLSPELTLERLRQLTSKVDPNIELEILGYGSLEYMIMKYNMTDTMKLDNANNIALEDKNKNQYMLYHDKYTHIMSHKKINLIEKIREFQNMGIDVFRLEFYLETKEEIIEIIRQIKTRQS